jgi:hypothetical protein
MCLQRFEVATIGQLDFAYPSENNPQELTINTLYVMRDEESG